MAKGQMRISLLNIPEDISALKLRGYLREEAKDIQGNCRENDLVLIRVFMPKKLRSQISQRELDKVFQGIVDKMPNIYRVEFVETKEQLNLEEMSVQAAEAKKQIDEIVERLNDNDPSTKPPVFH